MNIFNDIIDSQIYALAIALYILGIGIRKTKISNKFIPLIISAIGVVFILLRILATYEMKSFQDVCNAIFNAFVQGVLCAAVAVYADQIFKQIVRINGNSDDNFLTAASVIKDPSKALSMIEEDKEERREKRRRKKAAKKKKTNEDIIIDKEDTKDKISLSKDIQEEEEMPQVDGPRIDEDDNDDYEGE